MAPGVTTSVVIAAHTIRRRAQVRRSVESVRAGDEAPAAIVVVVDNNRELFEALASDLAGTARVVENEGRGLSAARNLGTRVATTDVVAFLDDDAWAEPAWLKELARAFDSDGSVVGVGGRIEPEYESGSRPVPPPLLWLVGCTYEGHPEGPVAISRPIGANMAYRRNAIVAAGGFDSEFGVVGGEKRTNSNEELAMASKLRASFGATCIRYVPNAVVHHLVPAERVSWAYLARRSAVEGRSKAAIRAITNADELGHDRSYLTKTLAPAIVRGAVRGITRFDGVALGDAVRCSASAVITGGAYLWTRARQRAAGSTLSREVAGS